MFYLLQESENGSWSQTLKKINKGWQQFGEQMWPLVTTCDQSKVYRVHIGYMVIIYTGFRLYRPRWDQAKVYHKSEMTRRCIGLALVQLNASVIGCSIGRCIGIGRCRKFPHRWNTDPMPVLILSISNWIRELSSGLPKNRSQLVTKLLSTKI